MYKTAKSVQKATEMITNFNRIVFLMYVYLLLLITRLFFERAGAKKIHQKCQKKDA